VHNLYEKTEDGLLQYRFHGGQRKAWDSKARFVCILSGTQGGKTTFGPPWMFREIQRRGPGDYLVATPTFPLLYVKALPEFRQLFERTLKLGRFILTPVKRFEFSQYGAAKIFEGRFPHGPTTIYFGHARDPDSLEAATYKAAWLDEVGQKKFKLGSWESIQRRLSIFEGRVLFTTTPYYLGWLKRQVADRAAVDQDYDLVRFESIANPAFPKSEWYRMEKTLPDWKFNLFYRALWSRPAGLIYDNFNETDKIKPFPIPKHWQRYIGIDFGGVNVAALYYAEDPNDGTFYAYRMYYPREKKTSEDHVISITSRIDETVIAVGGSPSEDQWRMEFKKAGLDVKKPPIKDVEVGIDRVYAAHQLRKIKVFDTLDRYIDEKESYSRVLDDAGETTDEIEDKSDYHIMDCERYLWALLGSDPGEARSEVVPPEDILDGLEF
jgi:hypothetical protein